MKFSRINLIYFFIFLCGGIIIARLAFLQVVQGELWKALARGQQQIFQPISGRRGDIFFQDNNGLILGATNKSFIYAFLSPRLINDKEKVAKSLALILDIPEKKILEEIYVNRESLFWRAKGRLSPEQASQIIELDLAGVYLGKEFLRYYLHHSLASDVLGFVNKDSYGQHGIEGYWNDVLIGKDGWRRVVHSPFGSFLKGDIHSSIKGIDVVLTIDKNIQSKAEKLLLYFSEVFDFEEAQIVVLRPSDGRILALADFPAFNPNKFREEEIALFKNRVIQTLYEPGSVFKTIVMAAALNEGKITPETTFVDRGYVMISRNKITNFDQRVWGERTMTEALGYSINTGAVFAQQQMSHDVFLDYLTRFGVFEKTNIGLQGEIFSENRIFKEGWDVNFATASFGHGIEMTLLQLARMYAAIANRGKLVQPYIVEQIIKNGRVEKVGEERIYEQILLPETAYNLTRMLVSTIEDGFGRRARVSGYRVAGKTGTSEIPFANLGINKPGYSDQTWQSFVGFAPAFSPEFVIAIKLNNPSSRTASESTTLIFRDLAKFILNYFQIPPTER